MKVSTLVSLIIAYYCLVIHFIRFYVAIGLRLLRGRSSDDDVKTPIRIVPVSK